MIKNRQSVRSGLTLLELMVVLVILAIVSTVALQSLQPQVESQRFDTATRLLTEIQSATIGPQQKYQVDGTPLISGFVSDMGRLPEISDGDEFTFESPPPNSPASVGVLSELWNAESQVAVRFPFQFRPGPSQPIDYSAVRIPCGWRGPYMQLPIGANSIRDPWGKAPELITDVKGQAQTVLINLPPTAAETEPKSVSVELAAGKVQVTGKVLLSNPDNSTVRIALLTPQPETSLTTLVVLDDEDPMPDSFLFRNVPVGLRAIVCETNGKKQIKYVQVPHSGLTVCFDCQEPAQQTASKAESPPANQ